MRFIKAEYLVAITTFLLGFGTWVIGSVVTDTFWPDSRVAFPLILIPTCTIGDAVFLPWLNFRLVLLLLKHFPRTWHRQLHGMWIAVSIVAAIIVNVHLHMVWISDNYTGFMDPIPGKLSFVGWWHLIFSVIQTTLLLLFLAMWLKTLTLRKWQAFTYAYGTWCVVTAFTSLSIGDYLVRQLVIFKSDPLSSIASDGWSMLTFVGAIVICFLGKLKLIHQTAKVL